MESMNHHRKPSRLVVYPGSPLRGEVSSSGSDGIPGDKSISHRAALFAALADGESVIDNFQVSGVTIPMLQALDQLGISWKLHDSRLSVRGAGLAGLRDPDSSLDCGNSATTMRLLAGALAGGGVSAILDGSNGLRRRPMNRIIDPLNRMGVLISSSNGCAPLTLRKSKFPLKAMNHTLQIASAQVKSSLLLAALAARGETTILEPGLSRDHTERMLRRMGARLESNILTGEGPKSYLTTIHPPEKSTLKPLQISIPGDFSAAAFLLVAACITPGSELVLRGIGMNPTRTGLLDALLAMGAKIDILSFADQSGEPVGDLLVRSSRLTGTEISGEMVVRMIDEFPILAIAAAYAQGITEVKDAAELRTKESDRISDLCHEIRTLGIEVYEAPDGFRIFGGRPVAGGKVFSHSDHRLAMSLAVAGMDAQTQVEVENAEAINESFPSFLPILAKIGASIART
jgi:3-phosphoshikimate 1-carboxyvinyltransferase